MCKKWVISVFVILILAACSSKKEPPEAFIDELNKIKMNWAPDKRTSVFMLNCVYADGKWMISGETSVPEAGTAVRELVNNTFAKTEVELTFEDLPQVSFGDTTMALVNVSVGNLRRLPKHSAEMVDQVLIGMELKLLKKERYWYLVQTPYDYLGWITEGTISRKTSAEIDNWRNARKVELNINFAQVFTEPSEKSQVISDLVLGAVFMYRTRQAKWFEIELPDGRIGYVENQWVKPYKRPGNAISMDRKLIVERARSMMGIPYLWGGNSTKAMDCSGFTSTVFKSFGHQLPRDANMQVKLGDEIVPYDDYSNIMAGDLIFFGPPERITHVGICLGGSYFIHESGDVHINSLDEQDPLFNPYRKRTFRHIKRIINN